MKQQTILIGTSNQGKLHEFEDAFSRFGIHITNPRDQGIVADIDESGSTFEENALIKARQWARLSQLPTMVDDSGLCVDALNGKPGIHSARFFPGTDHDRNNKILELLKTIEPQNRNAYYACVIAFVDPIKSVEHVTEGICKGHILQSPQGTGGFGYDPIFQPEGYNTSFGELPLEVKQKISHRAKALASMVNFLREWIQR